MSDHTASRRHYGPLRRLLARARRVSADEKPSSAPAEEVAVGASDSPSGHLRVIGQEELDALLEILGPAQAGYGGAGMGP